MTSLSMRKTLELDFVWEGSLRTVGYTVSRQEIIIAAFNWDNLRIASNALSTFGVGVLYGSTSCQTKSKRRPHVILENFK